MRPRQLPPACGVVLAAFSLLLCVTLTPGSPAADAAPSPAGPAPAAGPNDRPNVLVIFTDDMRADEMRYLPRTRRWIGGAGTTYPHAFSENPLCCPFRAVMLTGQYTHNNDVLGNAWARGGGYLALDPQENLHVTLRESGYTTAYFGKYLNEYPEQGVDRRYVPPGWSEWHVPTGEHYSYSSVQMNRNGRLAHYTGHKADVYGRLSSNLIARLARKPAPFFAMVSYLAPHFGTTGGRWHDPRPAPRHRGRLRNRMPGMGPGFNEPDVADKPAYVAALPRYGPRQVRALRRLKRARAESLMSVDQAIAGNLRRLKRTGELRNTIVVFTSDNGHLLGEHRIRDKRVPYEDSIHVPLMIRGPGFAPGQVNQSLVGVVDVASTVARAGRVVTRLPYEVDGRDLRWKRRLDDRAILLETGPALLQQLVVESRRSYVGVRTRRYLYARYWNGDEELYDLAEDPHQLRSRHDDPAYAAAKRQLQETLDRLEDCVGPACRGG